MSAHALHPSAHGALLLLLLVPSSVGRLRRLRVDVAVVTEVSGGDGQLAQVAVALGEHLNLLDG